MQISDPIVIKFTNIKWDTDGEKVKLPKTLTHTFVGFDLQDAMHYDCDEDDYTFKEDQCDEILCDWLSDTYGWCVEGFEWDIIH